jgi:hypothetical protein
MVEQAIPEYWGGSFVDCDSWEILGAGSNLQPGYLSAASGSKFQGCATRIVNATANYARLAKCAHLDSRTLAPRNVATFDNRAPATLYIDRRFECFKPAVHDPWLCGAPIRQMLDIDTCHHRRDFVYLLP